MPSMTVLRLRTSTMILSVVHMILSPRSCPPDDLYLRGTVTDAEWNPNDDVNRMTAVGKVYSLSVNLVEGTVYSFKFADEKWGLYNYGPGTVMLDSVASTAKGTHGVAGSGYYSNLTFTPAIDRYIHFLSQVRCENSCVLDNRGRQMM